MELRLRIIEARNLPKMDISDDSDPYCTISLTGHREVERTATIQNSHSPQWNESFVFDVLSYGTDVLTIQMYDSDLVSDDTMGKLEIRLFDLPPGQRVERWYPLARSRSCQSPGEIRISIQTALKGPREAVSQPFTRLGLRITVVEARGLVNSDLITKSDPYCVVTLGESSQTFKTSVKENTLAPVWNETVEFVVTNPQTEVLKVGIRDKDVAFDDNIGSVEVPIAKFADLRGRDDWYSVVGKNGETKSGKLRLVFQMYTLPGPRTSDDTPGQINYTKK
jgi:Ca2+-dependent lipid-binding protein